MKSRRNGQRSNLRVGETGVGEMGVGETGQIIGETGVGETGVGEMGVILCTIFAVKTNALISCVVHKKQKAGFLMT